MFYTKDEYSLCPAKNYYFEGIKNTFNKYELSQDNNKNWIAIERKTNTIYTDAEIVDRVKFVMTWYMSTLKNRARETTDILTVTQSDLNYAFGSNAEEVYNDIMNVINYQLINGNDINYIEIKNYLKKSTYKYADSILEGLFSKEHYIEALKNWSYRAVLGRSTFQSDQR